MSVGKSGARSTIGARKSFFQPTTRGTCEINTPASCKSAMGHPPGLASELRTRYPPSASSAFCFLSPDIFQRSKPESNRSRIALRVGRLGASREVAQSADARRNRGKNVCVGREGERRCVVNPNPRLGVFLRCHHASVRLQNNLTRPYFSWSGRSWGGCRLRGLRSFVAQWPRAKMLKEWPGFGQKLSKEFGGLLATYYPGLCLKWWEGGAS